MTFNQTAWKAGVRRYRWIAVLAGGLAFIGAGLWAALYFGLAPDVVDLPYFEISQKLEVPPRPGIQGIEITGEIITPVKFEIDISKPGLRDIDWTRLWAMDQGTDVRVTGHIDRRGHLTIAAFDDGGHTQAGKLIRDAMKTWIYKPYLSGTIRFWYNLPSTGSKVLVDVSKLRREAVLPDHVPLLFGRVHLIQNAPARSISTDPDF